ncbi:hypothetical protein AKJ09_00136 [Labilithrix luteola]|uniref:Uncharacterized protein n=1 Tax=Labilithrix luteola TaxID=1391654 RepID=A0A0K1PIX5_9BACT|nr:hypothetical protein [Labilithrix luteola]AKU93472.1 hypothetical protein AKJ09_00136 [Labilithrix luteola]
MSVVSGPDLMKLETHGDKQLVQSDRATLSSEATPAERGPWLLALRLEDQRTFDVVETTLRLSPATSEYEGFDWAAGRCLVIHGSEALVALNAHDLRIRCSVAFEYKEARLVGQPWYREAGDVLLIATDRRVWCLEQGGSMRWMWSCRLVDEYRFLSAPPEVVGSAVRLRLGSKSGEEAIELSLADGLETLASAQGLVRAEA